jgi:hypothetical protein
MAFGDRNNNDTVSLPQVQPYDSAAAAQHEPSGLVRFFMFLWIAGSVAVIILGLFFAGRWAFDTIRGEDEGTQNTAQTESEQRSNANQNQDKKQSNTGERTQPPRNNQNRNQNQPATGSGAGSSTGQQSAQSGNAQSEGTTPTTSTNNTSATAAGSSDSSPNALVSTGPRETVVAFIVTAAGVAIIHYVLMRRKPRNVR